MFCLGIGTAVPDERYSKLDCWTEISNSEQFKQLKSRSQRILESLLLKENGIEYRHLSMKSLDGVLNVTPDSLNQRFNQCAPQLAIKAGRQALKNAELTAQQIDAVIVSTCTGYLCPGLSSYVVEGLGLAPNVFTYDLVGQGCAAALPNWQMANALLKSQQCQHVLSICVEVCSAAVYLDDDPGVLISLCLFGDGAGAAVLSQQNNHNKRQIQWLTSATLTHPQHRNLLRFEQKSGMLRNILTPPVPRLAAEKAQEVLHSVLANQQLSHEDIVAWIWHAGGRDVLSAISETIGLSSQQIAWSSRVLRQYGNLSSAFVYFVLQAALDDPTPAPDGYWWMSSFGAGFSCHGALLSVQSC